MSSKVWRVWTLGPQTVVLLGKCVEPLGDGVLWDEVGIGEWALWSYSLATLSVFSLIPDYSCNVASLLLLLPPYVLYFDGLSLLEVSKANPSIFILSDL